MRPVVGHSYYIEGMAPMMWDSPHPQFGAPNAIAGLYLGHLQGVRMWHGFEVWLKGKEVGVIFMTEDDLSKLRVVDLDDPSAADTIAKIQRT